MLQTVIIALAGETVKSNRLLIEYNIFYQLEALATSTMPEGVAKKS